VSVCVIANYEVKTIKHAWKENVYNSITCIYKIGRISILWRLQYHLHFSIINSVCHNWLWKHHNAVWLHWHQSWYNAQHITMIRHLIPELKKNSKHIHLSKAIWMCVNGERENFQQKWIFQVGKWLQKTWNTTIYFDLISDFDCQVPQPATFACFLQCFRVCREFSWATGFHWSI